MAKKRILFVDDDANILQGLRRMLHGMRQEWDMAFAGSGAEALRLMSTQPFDLVVSDFRMPGMDGADLLTEVMKRHPQTVRFVLSGQTDNEAIFRSVGPTHQFISKPCDAETLRTLVARAFALRDLLQNENLKKLLSQMQTLPSLPDTYAQLTQELKSPDCSIKTVGEIIGRDVGMSAKLLQLVNSAFFGLRNQVSSPVQAASLLGIETLRSLVLVVHVFSEVEGSRLPSGYSAESLRQHSMIVGTLAKTIARQETTDKKTLDDAFMAGLLHDAGKLVLATNQREAYERSLTIAAQKAISHIDAEREVFSSTHAEVGAYLLGLWGLPDSIVEAVAFHHAPSDCLGTGFSPLTAVHVANACAYETEAAQPSKPPAAIHLPYLQSLKLEGRLDAWRQACKTALHEVDRRD